MAEFVNAHKTDSQKTWSIRDIKLRGVPEKRKLKSSTFAATLAGFNGFPAPGPCGRRVKPVNSG
jgi:hypothetical protein